jgi:hypothetical protein
MFHYSGWKIEGATGNKFASKEGEDEENFKEEL